MNIHNNLFKNQGEVEQRGVPPVALNYNLLQKVIIEGNPTSLKLCRAEGGEYK